MSHASDPALRRAEPTPPPPIPAAIRRPVSSDAHRTRRHSGVGKIYGSYRTLGLLGEGGMGKVYLAEHVRLGRKVALKVLKPRLAARPEMLQQFFDEARAVNRIRHPNIVDVVDLVAEGDGAYCVMEYLPGQTLSKTLRLAGGALEPGRGLQIASQVADALQAAHDAGIVHLDVKPSNILLLDPEEPAAAGGEADPSAARGARAELPAASAAPRVKLMDFGTARLLEESDDEWAERDTAPLFTPVYVSPEVASGQAVDARADIYSLGVVLYEMLTGAPPFVASSLAEYCYKHLKEPPTRITQLRGLPHRIPRRVSAAAMRCLEKAPRDRFQSAAALRDVLDEPQMDSGRFRTLTAGADGPAPRRWPWLVAGLTAVAAAAAGLTLWAWPSNPGEPLGPPGPALPSGSGLGALAPMAGDDADGDADNNKDNNKDHDSKSTVFFRLRSDPSGAEVIDPGPPRRLIGLTPLSLHRPRTTQTWRLKIRHPGYRQRSVAVSLDRSRTLFVALDELPGKPAGESGEAGEAGEAAEAAEAKAPHEAYEEKKTDEADARPPPATGHRPRRAQRRPRASRRHRDPARARRSRPRPVRRGGTRPPPRPAQRDDTVNPFQ
jgi:serine/threonine-protein kinase